MDVPDDPVPLPAMRVGDADREAAADRLRTAVADGRLEFTELDERLTAVYGAKTRAELAAVTADLEPAQPDTRPLTLRTESGSIKRTGHWEVPARIVAECTSGSIKLDFTQAGVPHREVRVHATASSGSVVLIVPYGWVVVMDDVSSSSGSIRNKVGGRPGPHTQVLRVTGSVRSGTIKARYPRRSFWDWLRGRKQSTTR
ncbi:MAG TPA: DUF1707 domain-containing protein [Jiangellales bacterium]|nr:DUF1707 domain-containing protein [Jiangellales bacterium]